KIHKGKYGLVAQMHLSVTGGRPKYAGTSFGYLAKRTGRQFLVDGSGCGFGRCQSSLARTHSRSAGGIFRVRPAQPRDRCEAGSAHLKRAGTLKFGRKYSLNPMGKFRI